MRLCATLSPDSLLRSVMQYLLQAVVTEISELASPDYLQSLVVSKPQAAE